MPSWPPSRCVLMSASFAQVCRETGARVSTNTFVRNGLDGRRLEIIADGLVGGRKRLVVLAAEVGETMVERTVLECFGGGTVTVSRTHLAKEGEGRLASSLERHAGLQRSAGVRVFFFGRWKDSARWSTQLAKQSDAQEHTVGAVKSSQKGLVPHLSLPISNSAETCALPCRTGLLASPSTNVQEWVPSRGVVVVLGLATVAMWHSSPGPTLLLPEQLCLQTTHPSARDREPWKLGGPQHHPTSACDDTSMWKLLLLVPHCLSTIPPTCHPQTSQIASATSLG